VLTLSAPPSRQYRANGLSRGCFCTVICCYGERGTGRKLARPQGCPGSLLHKEVRRQVAVGNYQCKLCTKILSKRTTNARLHSHILGDGSNRVAACLGGRDDAALKEHRKAARAFKKSKEVTERAKTEQQQQAVVASGSRSGELHSTYYIG